MITSKLTEITEDSSLPIDPTPDDGGAYQMYGEEPTDSDFYLKLK